MPRGMLDLSPHILTSQYRGPHIFNEAGTPPPADPPPAPKAGEGGDTPPPPPKDKGDETEGRISKLVDERNELKKQLKAIEDAKKGEEDEKLKKKGEFEKLLGDREKELETLKGESGTTKDKLDAYEKVLKGQLDTALKGIADEAKRNTVQKLLDGKSLADQVALLPEVMQAIGAQGPSAFGGGTPPGTPPVTTTKEGLTARLNELNIVAQEKNQKGETLSWKEESEMRDTEKKLRELKFPTT